MAFVEVTDISYNSCEETGLAGFFLDTPVVGYQSDSPFLDVIGWCLGRDEAPIGVHIAPLEQGDTDADPRICAALAQLESRRSHYIVPDSTRILTPVNRPRRDVAAAFPHHPEVDRCGFEAAFGVIGMPRPFEIVVQAVFADGSKRTVATIRGNRHSLRSSFVPDLQPLMVTILGRTGSTWLMRLLSQHSQVYVNPSQHYETRLASHWMHMVKVTAEVRRHFHVLDNADYASFLSNSYLEEIAAFAQKSIDRAYGQFLALEGRRGVVYFAEKFHQDHVPRLVWELYPRAREIFLVRDPRDMLSSILAINAKRGGADFLGSMVDSDREFVDAHRRGMLGLLATWQSRADHAIMVRYEDLILQPLATLRRIFDYLSLDSSALTIERVIQSASIDTPEMAFHRTSSSVFNSIGRWRHDLPANLQAACQEGFGEILGTFGYEG